MNSDRSEEVANALPGWRTGLLRSKLALRRTVKQAVRMVGYDISPYYPERKYPPDFAGNHISTIEKVKPYTMTPDERVYALIEATSHIVRQKIPGDIVECGVWRGGSMMAAALTLMELNSADRDLYLFDTFEGMPKPGAEDVDWDGSPGLSTFLQLQTGADTSLSCYASLPDVQAAMATTGYAAQRIHFIKGKVENTLPLKAPDSIALLRLDTDWYESTRHELEHLFPRLSVGGILIIDDYGAWRGAKKATDEYLERHAPSMFLSRIDSSARITVKTGPA